MKQKKFTLAELEQLTGSILVGHPDYCITGVDALDTACAQDASFLANPKYRPLLKETKAGVICIDKQTPLDEGKQFLISDDPSCAFQSIIKALLLSTGYCSAFSGIHSTAVIHPSAKIGVGVQIGP